MNEKQERDFLRGAFCGDPALKDAALNEARLHQRHDRIKKGAYWHICDDGEWRGCAIGCMAGDTPMPHLFLATKFNIPEPLFNIQDSVFEGLPTEQAISFVYDFYEAVPTSAELSLVLPKFMHWMLINNLHGVYQFADESGKKAIAAVAELCEVRGSGEEVGDEEWFSAMQTANCASDEAITTAHEAAVTAARYACHTCDSSKWGASYAVIRARDAGVSAGAMRDKFLELLRGAPPCWMKEIGEKP